MEAFTLHAEPSRTEPDRAWPSVFPGWCLFLLASRRPILLRNRSNFLELKCVCTQKPHFLVNKRLLHQILFINENTCTWFDILALTKCRLQCFNPLNPELNPICYLLALLGAHHFLHVSRIRVKLLSFRLLMSYIYGAPILDVSRTHTTTHHSR